ncbi:MAG: thioredoxin-disulfide reductase [Peptostreptococcales bacterium]
MEKIYDILIIGAGPAGLAAGIYAARARMSTVIIEKGVPGGQIFSTHQIANYPGSIDDETGPGLSKRMEKQAKEFGAEIITDEITEVELEGEIKTIKGNRGSYKAKSIIIATGAYPKTLGAAGEMEHVGAGVSYCATCDGGFYSGLEVFVVGGGDSALQEALYLTRFAKKVTILHRRKTFRGAKSLQEKVEQNEKIKVLMNTVIEEIKGEGVVESVLLKNTVTGQIYEYKADSKDGILGVFVFVGYKPNSKLFETKVDLDEWRYIKTDEKMKTNIQGVFAAGDIRSKSLRQVVTAVSDGAIAAIEAEEYIDKE